MQVISTIRLPMEALQKLPEINIVFITENDLHPGHDLLQEAEIIACNQWHLSRDFLVKCPKLQWVQIPSSGYDRVDTAYLKEKNILLTNARGVYSIPIAEHVLGHMLMLARNSKTYVEQQQKHHWGYARPVVELHQKVVGILGTGSIAGEIASRVRALNMCVLGYNTNGRSVPWFDKVVSRAELPTLFAESDFVISTLPLSPETKGFIDHSLLGAMKPESYFINISRGEVVVEKDLVAILQAGKIRGAALDVFGTEPLPADSILWDLPNLIISPHVAGAGDQSWPRMQELFLHNLRAFPNYRQMTNMVLPDFSS